MLEVKGERRTQALFELHADALKQLGWTKTRLRIGDGSPLHGYKRGEAPHRRIEVGANGLNAKPSAFYKDTNY